MARIAGVNIPLNKRVEVGLTYVYGIGHSTAGKIVESAPAEQIYENPQHDYTRKLLAAVPAFG